MNEQETASDQDLQPLKWVHAHRVSTGEETSQPVEEAVCVVNEAPLTIDVEGIGTYTLLCTPTDKLALAAGFLYTEGVYKQITDIVDLKECYHDPSVVRVRFTGSFPRPQDTDRNLLIVSSCGACGSEDLIRRIESIPAVEDDLRIDVHNLRTVHESLYRRQKLFHTTGGTHAAAVFDESGNILSFAEDIGRHNALDKAIGKCLFDEIPLTKLGVVLTSRLSLEMVTKCAVAGIELISSVSAPTTIAIDIAEKCNITLCAFVRQTRATVFTHSHRIIIDS